MDLERVLADASDALARRKFKRGTKKVILGNGRKQALLRAVLVGFARRYPANQEPAPTPPRLRLTTRAIHDCRVPLGFPTLGPDGASDALYDWSRLLEQPQVVDVEDGHGIARVTLQIRHEPNSESFDLSIDVQRDANERHDYVPVLQSGQQVCDVRVLFPDLSESSAPRLVRPSPERERRTARLLSHADRDKRSQLREKLGGMSDPEFDRFDQDYWGVHQIRPAWAKWILVGIVGVAACGYAAYRYYASISVQSPARFLVSENIQVMPDGTFVIADVGIKTSAIENRETGERVTVTPTGTDGSFEVSYENAQHIVDGIETRALHDKFARWAGDIPGIALMPLREVFAAVHARSRTPVSPTLFMAYVIPAQDATLAEEIRNRTARCTMLFSRSPAASGLIMPPSPFDAGTPADHIWGWSAVHEYPRTTGRYDIKARVTRADGRVEHYSRVLFIDERGPHPGTGENQGVLGLWFNSDEPSIPLHAGTAYDDCCYAGEPLRIDTGAYVRLLERQAAKDGPAQRFWVVWESAGWSEEVPIRTKPDRTIDLALPTHAFGDPGRREVHLTVTLGPNISYTTIVPVEVKPARLH